MNITPGQVLENEYVSGDIVMINGSLWVLIGMRGDYYCCYMVPPPSLPYAPIPHFPIDEIELFKTGLYSIEMCPGNITAHTYLQWLDSTLGRLRTYIPPRSLVDVIKSGV